MKKHTDQSKYILIMISLCFLLGGVIGCFFGSHPTESMTNYINHFFQAAKEGSVVAPGLLEASWTILRWPLLVIALHFSFVGLVGIPVLFVVRGFLLAFNIAAFASVLGDAGIPFLLLGAESLLSIPVLFLLGSYGISVLIRPKQIAVSRKKSDKIVYMRGIVICGGLLLFCIMWEQFVTPILLRGAF
ncbi:MAG: hypothetical protein RR053_03750 [Evtepia sp.]